MSLLHLVGVPSALRLQLFAVAVRVQGAAGQKLIWARELIEILCWLWSLPSCMKCIAVHQHLSCVAFCCQVLWSGHRATPAQLQGVLPARRQQQLVARFSGAHVVLDILGHHEVVSKLLVSMRRGGSGVAGGAGEDGEGRWGGRGGNVPLSRTTSVSSQHLPPFSPLPGPRSTWLPCLQHQDTIWEACHEEVPAVT